MSKSDGRVATWFGAALLFGAVTAAFLRRPDLAALLYPLYGLLFLWFDFRGESQSQILFVFLITLAGLVWIAAPQAAAARPLYFAQMLGLWAAAWGLSNHQDKAATSQRDLEAEEAVLGSGINDLRKDLEYQKAYQGGVEEQIRLRKSLTEAARHLGSTLDAQEVHRRLTHILSSRYPESRVQILAQAGLDPLLSLAQRALCPVLVQDAASDQRLGALGPVSFKSGVAIPLKVMRQWSGFLKIESDMRGGFSSEDLKTVDLFATMATLSLENIRFYDGVQAAATHDSLTHLFSHRAFQDRLKEELLRAGRGNTPLSFILCDVDHFKQYNDNYGHQAGDQLLRTVAAILASFARPVDFAARYGGEEFCLILPHFTRALAVELAGRLRARVEAAPFVFQGQKTQATLSIGVASFPQDATTPSQIIRVADERLYRAKNQGRNQVVG